jgi:3-oxoacyl-[acyl-carrier protein] reductase
MRLLNKVALVTGAASGFGAGIARRFAEEGATVILNDIQEAQGKAVAKDLGPRAHFHKADVTSMSEMQSMIQTVCERFGRLDIMVNNAGITHRNRPMLEVSEEEFDRVYAVNVKALYIAAQVVVPQMMRQGGGVILTTASTAGLRPRPGLTWYNGSKGAAIVITKSMAVELAPHRIRVNALCPVMGETALLEDFLGAKDTPENRKRVEAGIPLGRLSRPQDVAQAAVYLASDEAEFITGVALEIDGGRCI